MTKQLAFIDTNVLSRYLIYLNQEKNKETDEEKKSLWDRYGTKFKSSYVFILNVVKLGNKNIKFVTCNLVFAEIFNSLYEEAVCKKLWDDGIPLSSWERTRKRKNFINLTNPEIGEIKNVIRQFKKEKNLKKIEEDYNIHLIPKLINLDLRTQDSILFCTALKRKCSFFITSDEQDFHSNTRLKGEFRGRIELLTPQKAIERFFPEPKNNPPLKNV